MSSVKTKLILVGLLTVGMVVGSMSGCAKKPVESKPVAPTVSAAPAPAPPPAPSRTDMGEGIRMPDAISEGRTSAPMLPIYFDFDKYNIRPDMKARMQTNAKFLADNPQVRIEIQGNCDERGTNEYNLGLGERRAKAAKDYLSKMGIAPNRMDVVSLGEEQPLDPGHNEAAWAKNRRDDFVIIKK